MENDALKEISLRMVMLSMQLFHLAYRDKMGKDSGEMALMVLASAFDGLLEELEKAPIQPLSPAVMKNRGPILQKTLQEISALATAAQALEK